MEKARRPLNAKTRRHISLIELQNGYPQYGRQRRCRAEGQFRRCVQETARQEGVSVSGFRVVTNCGRDGAQSVEHLHFHLLGGDKLSESMA